MTFGFPEQTGTDRGGYSTIVTDYFKAAVKQQMEMRGYRYVDENPSLLVNFYANVRERTEVRSRPGGSLGFCSHGFLARLALWIPRQDVNGTLIFSGHAASCWRLRCISMLRPSFPHA